MILLRRTILSSIEAWTDKNALLASWNIIKCRMNKNNSTFVNSYVENAKKKFVNKKIFI
jgi:hypothetical protein